MSKQDILNALDSKNAMAEYLEVRNDGEIIADVRSLMPPGLTKREYFAAAALTGIVGPNYEWFTSNSEEFGSRVHSAAHFALSLADALIAASKSGGSDE